MSDPYLGEIRVFGFNYAPKGWAMCQGQNLSIAQNSALFALLGTQYGGDGVQTFALPNIQSRFLVGAGQGGGLSPYTQGQVGGGEQVTLTINQLPRHNHTVTAETGAAAAQSPAGALLANTTVSRQQAGPPVYTTTTGTETTMAQQMIQPTGNSQPTPTVPPYLAMNFCIALQGIFPPRN